ncbi:hypothetical protein H8356DRAFT_1343357 [Neocallimastix lanati (nom. inval.)]|nr:hypothetical protein H8356DRAFT_1343357 [Neocallimastix sp. JGI-2020a]
MNYINVVDTIINHKFPTLTNNNNNDNNNNNNDNNNSNNNNNNNNNNSNTAGDGAGTGADSLNSSFLNMYNLLKILNVNKTCASTRISRFYIDYIDYINNDGAPEYVRKLRKIWEKKDIVIIEGEESRLDKNKLVLIVLGLTTTVLAYDLYKNGYQAIDIGHFIRNATRRTKIEYKYINEIRGGNFNIQNVTDENYFKQLIAKILNYDYFIII